MMNRDGVSHNYCIYTTIVLIYTLTSIRRTNYFSVILGSLIYEPPKREGIAMAMTKKAPASTIMASINTHPPPRQEVSARVFSFMFVVLVEVVFVVFAWSWLSRMWCVHRP